MAKLFLFGIGGTGSRVIKALAMLLASGVNIKNTDTIIPIIIDPDSANGDLTRTVQILKRYKAIYQKAHSSESSFFSTKINSLDEVSEEGSMTSDNFRFEIDGIKDHIFKDYIGYGELDFANKALASLLFSDENLAANMEVGFKGNPNIGSVVLNRFRDTTVFRKFAQSFGQNDRVFIISSIFGGTGAAGFPLILKNIRAAENPVPNHASLNNAKIGAVTILPYFSVDNTDKKTVIESDTFVSKAKAALSYYARNVSGNKSINNLYYAGDQFADNKVAGADGDADQKNNAHFIELIAALSVIDFMSYSDADLAVANGKAENPRFFEFGLTKESSNIVFQELGNRTKGSIARPLTQYSLFDIFFRKHYRNYDDAAFAKNGNNKLIREQLDSSFTATLESFNGYFEEWLRELRKSTVAFAPLNLDVPPDDILNLVVNAPEKRSINPFAVKGLEYYVQALNKTDEKDNLDSLGDTNKKLLATFAKTTDRIITEKIPV